jgi:hypothetical protein
MKKMKKDPAGKWSYQYDKRKSGLLQGVRCLFFKKVSEIVDLDQIYDLEKGHLLTVKANILHNYEQNQNYGAMRGELYVKCA